MSVFVILEWLMTSNTIVLTVFLLTFVFGLLFKVVRS